jgi:hypothetical protein
MRGGAGQQPVRPVPQHRWRDRARALCRAAPSARALPFTISLPPPSFPPARRSDIKPENMLLTNTFQVGWDE